MALIGTISGSNGTSTTAISGSLIIADEPLSRFPALASGVKLFVSGNKTQLGADTPNSIFGGDTFVSGAFGTDSYIQMKPVGTLAIPTNTTASYIYTSGSTNDIYFTQYSGPYTNTTRLRWLESTLSTGLLHGGILSTANGSTTFSITSGSGLIIDYNASTADDPYPTIIKVDWPAYVSSSLPNIATTEITYIAIDSTGALVKQSTAYTDGDFEDKIVIGRVLHQNGSVTNGTITTPTVAYGQTGFRGDFVRAFGPLKLSGHVVSVNATATNPPTNTQFLGLAKTSGDSYVEGRNYTTNPNSPNYVKSITDTALTTSKIYREYVNGSGTVVIDSGVGGAGYTAIDVTNYNNAGTLTAIGAGNNFTIQRLYWFPNSVNRAIFAYYGNAIYSTIDDAEAGIRTEEFTEGDNTRDAAILLGYLIVKQGATNLGNATQAKLIQAGLSRAIASTGGGGGSTTPGGSDTYVQYNDAGSFGGTNDFRFIEGTGTVLAANLFVTGTAAGSLVSSGTFQVKGGSGNVVGYITTSGEISGSGNIDSGGAITAAGNLRSIHSSGDEGGEIFLSKSVTNTTLTGGVTIDVWQNRLRMFEQGGSARGYYLDMTSGSDGVNTNLLYGDPMAAFLSRKILIAQAIDGNAGSGNFGVFPYAIQTSVSNTAQVMGTTDNVMSFTTPATTGTPAFFRTTNVWARAGHTGRLRLRVVTGADITSQTITFGLGTGTANSSYGYAPAGESQILAVYNAGTANWMLLTSDGAATTTTSTGVAVAINTEYYLDLTFTGSSASLRVNGSAAATHTTNLPGSSTNMYARIGIVPTTNSARSMSVIRTVYEVGRVLTF